MLQEQVLSACTTTSHGMFIKWLGTRGPQRTMPAREKLNMTEPGSATLQPDLVIAAFTSDAVLQDSHCLTKSMTTEARNPAFATYFVM